MKTKKKTTIKENLRTQFLAGLISENQLKKVNEILEEENNEGGKMVIGYDKWPEAIRDFIYDNLSDDEEELPDIINALNIAIARYEDDMEALGMPLS